MGGVLVHDHIQNPIALRQQRVSHIPLFEMIGEKGRELVPRNEVHPVV